MATKVKPIPDGFRTVTPYLTLNAAADAIKFYQKAFGAEVKCLVHGPDGKVAHCELQIGDSRIMMGDEFPMGHCKSPKTLGGATGGVNLYVEDVDTLFSRAVAAGAKVEMPVQNMFWGDRYGKLSDPFGHEWSVATHIEDVSSEEIERRSAAAFRQMSQRAQGA